MSLITSPNSEFDFHYSVNTLFEFGQQFASQRMATVAASIHDLCVHGGRLNDYEIENSTCNLTHT